MYKNMAALAQCENDFIKLRILSARDPELLEGYQRAWPQYFTSSQQPPIPFSQLREDRIQWLIDETLIDSPEEADRTGVQGIGLGEVCPGRGIPVIKVVFPWDSEYKKSGIHATRGLQFQLGDFSEVTIGSIIRLYHTSWLVVRFVSESDPLDTGVLGLAPPECIDFDS